MRWPRWDRLAGGVAGNPQDKAGRRRVDVLSVRVPGSWLWRVGVTAAVWVVAVGVVAYQVTAAALAAPATADTQAPAVHLLGVLAMLGARLAWSKASRAPPRASSPPRHRDPVRERGRRSRPVQRR